VPPVHHVMCCRPVFHCACIPEYTTAGELHTCASEDGGNDRRACWSPPPHCRRACSVPVPLPPLQSNPGEQQPLPRHCSRCPPYPRRRQTAPCLAGPRRVPRGLSCLCRSGSNSGCLLAAGALLDTRFGKNETNERCRSACPSKSSLILEYTLSIVRSRLAYFCRMLKKRLYFSGV
jgi:hypothetical protein